MVTQIDPISTPPTPADTPADFEQKASQVWGDLFKAVPKMNLQALEMEAIGQAAVAAGQSARAGSDAALGYRNEARAARDATVAYENGAAGFSAAASAARVNAESAASNADGAAKRSEAAAKAAGDVVANAVHQTSSSGVALLPQGGNGGLPPVGSIPAGFFLLRGSTEDPSDYRPEFWNRVAAAWQTLSSREWIIGYVSQLFQRIAALESAPKPIAPGSAPQYVPRAWVNFSGATIRASGNISSVAKSSTGIFVANLITAVSDVNCAAVCTGSNGSVARLSTAAEMISTTQCRMAFHQVGTGDVDPTNASLIIVR